MFCILTLFRLLSSTNYKLIVVHHSHLVQAKQGLHSNSRNKIIFFKKRAKLSFHFLFTCLIQVM